MQRQIFEMKTRLSVGVLAATLMLGAAERSEASIVMNAVEVGGNVVITAIGTYDFSGMIADGGNPYSELRTAILPSRGDISFGSTEPFSMDYYFAASTVPFGTGLPSRSDSSVATGDYFGLASDGSVGGTVGKTSGTVDSTMTFLSATFNSLGMTEGTYTWTWGPETADEVPESIFSASNDAIEGRGAVLTVGGTPVVPLPAGLPLLLTGLGAFAWTRRRRD